MNSENKKAMVFIYEKLWFLYVKKLNFWAIGSTALESGRHSCFFIVK
jgi:hypothetical protein